MTSQRSEISEASNRELLIELSARVASGEISQQEIDSSLRSSSLVSDASTDSVLPASTLMKLLYIVGAIFISVGVLYLVSGAACLLSPSLEFTNPWPMGLVFFLGESIGGFILYQHRLTDQQHDRGNHHDT